MSLYEVYADGEKGMYINSSLVCFREVTSRDFLRNRRDRSRRPDFYESALLEAAAGVPDTNIKDLLKERNFGGEQRPEGDALEEAFGPRLYNPF